MSLNPTTRNLIVFSAIGLLLTGAYAGARYIQFEQDIGGHLKRAADANQPIRAIEELDLALAGIGRHSLDRCVPNQCFTSVIYTTPAEDIGFWAENIQDARDDLSRLPADADHLVVSNSLMKLRETLLDGSEVTAPRGISRYPANGVFGFLFGACGIGFLFGCIRLALS